MSTDERAEGEPMGDPAPRVAMVETADAAIGGVIRMLETARTEADATTFPTARDISIAITHLEDALLRLRHGTPR